MTYCPEAMLNYAAVRRRFAPGDRLDFDASYRTFHLPLVVPGHPLACDGRAAGRPYVNGYCDPPRLALTVMVDGDRLMRTPAYRALDAELRAARFAPKIAWAMSDRRRDLLHTTLAVDFPEAAIDDIATSAAAALRRLGRVSFAIRGPFVGDRNFGRLYLPVYPALAAGGDPFATIQRAIGARPTALYTIGLHHLTDPLDADETADLAALIDRWRAVTLDEQPLKLLDLHATGDALVLTAKTLRAIPADFEK